MKTVLPVEENLMDLISKASVRWAKCLSEGDPADILAASREMAEFVVALAAPGANAAASNRLLDVQTACKSLLKVASGGDALCAALADMTARREGTPVYGPSGTVRQKDSRAQRASA